MLLKEFAISIVHLPLQHSQLPPSEFIKTTTPILIIHFSLFEKATWNLRILRSFLVTGALSHFEVHASPTCLTHLSSLQIHLLDFSTSRLHSSPRLLQEADQQGLHQHFSCTLSYDWIQFMGITCRRLERRKSEVGMFISQAPSLWGHSRLVFSTLKTYFY